MRFIFILDITGTIATEIEKSFFLFDIIIPIVFNEAVVLSFLQVFTFNVVFFSKGFLFTIYPFYASIKVLVVFKLNNYESGRTIFEVNHIKKF
jgi:hypothetical protein